MYRLAIPLETRYQIYLHIGISRAYFQRFDVSG